MDTASTDRGPRWPGAVAAVLAVTLIGLTPNPFLLRNIEPRAQAEYAPVPGPPPPSGEANFARLAAPSTPGLLGSVYSPLGPELSVLPEFQPRQLECVGDPPRQTEDPMSPPCVPFFTGPNGGATARGVTGDAIEIEVAVQYLRKELDLNAPWKPSDEVSELEAAASPLFHPHLARTLKAHFRFFSRRYQTYGREVRGRAIPVGTFDDESGWSRTCADQKAAADATARREPFAVAYVGYWGSVCYRRAILANRIPFFGVNYDLAREEYQENAPYLWGFFGDQETTAALSASLLCRSLKDRLARFSPDPALQGQTRSFAVVYPEDWTYSNDANSRSHGVVAKKTAAAAERLCDLPVELRGYPNDGPIEEVVELKRGDITTLLCRCPGVHLRNWTTNASAIRWYPEWFVDLGMASAFYGRLLTSNDQVGFGAFPRWRHPAFRLQQHYRAFQSMEPGATPNAILSADIYYTFHTLFSAIQTAGPTLTADNIQLGMYTLNLLDPADPWQPAGGWGTYGVAGTNPQTFVDSAMAWTFDPAGTPPGGTAADGCFRAVLDGRRFFAGEWPQHDRYLFAEGDPCTGSDVEGMDDR